MTRPRGRPPMHTRDRPTLTRPRGRPLTRARGRPPMTRPRDKQTIGATVQNNHKYNTRLKARSTTQQQYMHQRVKHQEPRKEAYKIKTGNILQATQDYIVHQTNCITKQAAGLAGALFKKYAYANTYTNRVRPHRPGTCSIHTSEQQPNIVNLYGQYLPGKPKAEGSDTKAQRLRYFEQALAKLRIKLRESNKQNITIAVPWKIGCGLGGGEWAQYEKALKRWTTNTNNEEKFEICMTIYKLPTQANNKQYVSTRVNNKQYVQQKLTKAEETAKWENETRTNTEADTNIAQTLGDKQYMQQKLTKAEETAKWDETHMDAEADTNIAQTLKDIQTWDTIDNQKREKQEGEQRKQMKALLNSIKAKRTKQRAAKIIQQKEIEEKERYVKNVSEMRRLLIRCALQCDAEKERSKMYNIQEQDFETCEELTEEEEEAISLTHSNNEDMEDMPPEMDEEAANDSANAHNHSDK